MRTNLFFSGMENETNSVVVTSSVEKEGKTTTAVNLAYIIAQTERKVLLMDCDLRRPHMSALISGPQEIGVTELIADVFGKRPTQGNLTTYSVSDLITLTKLQKRSTRLELENARTQVVIFFQKGEISDINLKNRPETKKLANALIQQKLLTKEEAQLALDHQKNSGQPLGKILYTMGFISKKDLTKALSIHTIEAIRALSSMTDGEFCFSSVPQRTKTSSISQGVDAEKLYNEFFTSKEDYRYISQAIDEAIHGTDSEYLFILPSGGTPPNPSELVASQRMDFLIQYLKTRFDFLLIDTPPVAPASDAVLIAPRTEGTIFVIKSGHTERKIIQDVVDQYRSANLPIIGTVLNQVDMRKEGYYRYYHKYYSSYYGN